MTAHGSPSRDPVESWLHEHDPAAVQGRTDRAGFAIPGESILGGLFLLWGTLLLFLFAFDVTFGGLLAVFRPWIRLSWIVSVVLSAAGSWLAFELSNLEGFEVSREPSP
ncbi:MAG: hypothetical protein L3K18_06905 [Thermoplasmata archaeon]|nr:hypothetical protein [Thermoplasmata archaeon]MCI4356852.1 hypothetical protein [Thermoplasmata archaeon]